MRLITMIAAVWMLSLSMGQSARADWHSSLPGCGDPKVLSKIIFRFNEADRDLWHHQQSIYKISGIYERSFEDYYASNINRRYCYGGAILASGERRKVYYVIEQGMGLAGFGWNVEYCLRGSDGWYAYDGWCRVLRP